MPVTHPGRPGKRERNGTCGQTVCAAGLQLSGLAKMAGFAVQTDPTGRAAGSRPGPATLDRPGPSSIFGSSGPSFPAEGGVGLT